MNRNYEIKINKHKIFKHRCINISPTEMYTHFKCKHPI